MLSEWNCKTSDNERLTLQTVVKNKECGCKGSISTILPWFPEDLLVNINIEKSIPRTRKNPSLLNVPDNPSGIQHAYSISIVSPHICTPNLFRVKILGSVSPVDSWAGHSMWRSPVVCHPGIYMQSAGPWTGASCDWWQGTGSPTLHTTQSIFVLTVREQ